MLFFYRWFGGIYFGLRKFGRKMECLCSILRKNNFSNPLLSLQTKNSHPSLILRSLHLFLWSAVAELWVFEGRITKGKHCAVRAIETLASGQEWVSLRITRACLQVGSMSGGHPGSPSAQSYRPAQETACFNSSGTPGRPFLVKCKPLLTRTRPTLSSNPVILKECLKNN